MNRTSFAYLSWKDCLKKQKEFRVQLALPKDDKEDEKMCRYAFRLHFSAKLKDMKSNCCKTDMLTEDDDY